MIRIAFGSCVVSFFWVRIRKDLGVCLTANLNLTSPVGKLPTVGILQLKVGKKLTLDDRVRYSSFSRSTYMHNRRWGPHLLSA